MPKWFLPFAGLTAVMFAASPFVIAQRPYESTMGLVQKIFYYHMPSAWMFLLSAIVCGIASARYPVRRLAAAGSAGVRRGGADGAVRRDHAGDRAALGAQGVGHLVAVGRAADLEPHGLDGRVGVSARAAVRRARARTSWPPAWRSSAMANVPFIYISVNYWRTIHPATSVVPTLPARMGLALWFCVVVLPAAVRPVASPARAARRAAREARCALPFTG